MNNSDPQELKAKSRITVKKTDSDSSSSQKNSKSKVNPSKDLTTWKTWSRRSRSSGAATIIKLPDFFSPDLLKARGVYLAIAVLLWLILAVIFTQVHPDEVANVLLYQSYLPVLLLFAASMYLLGKFIFQKNHSSAIFSAFFTIIVFCKLQQVVINLPLIGVLLLILGAIEAIFRLVIRK